MYCLYKLDLFLYAFSRHPSVHTYMLTCIPCVSVTRPMMHPEVILQYILVHHHILLVYTGGKGGFNYSHDKPIGRIETLTHGHNT
jgi:hypothetical protein